MGLVFLFFSNGKGRGLNGGLKGMSCAVWKVVPSRVSFGCRI